MHASADKAIFILLDATRGIGTDTGFHSVLGPLLTQSQIPKHASTIECTQKAA